MLTGYTFFVDDGVTETQVYPRNPNLVWSDTPDDNNGFYRRRLTTTVVFSGDDYTLLKTEDDANDCTVWDFVVKYETVEVFRGYMRFDTSAFRWDISNCKVTVRIDPQDYYTCFVRGWDDEINIFTGTTTNSVVTHYGIIECETCIDIISEPSYPLLSIPFAECDPALNESDGWTVTSNIVDSVFPDEEEPPPIGLTTVYCRQFVDDASHVAEPPGDGWINVTGGWARVITVTPDLANSYLTTPSPQDELVEAFFTPGLNLTDPAEPVISEIDNGVLLADILEIFAPCGLGVISDFFNINPDATAPSNDAYTWAAEFASAVMVWQKSDVKRPGATNNATNGKWTYQGLCNALKTAFNVRIRVDATDIRIEHVSYFAASNGDDLVTDFPDRLAGLEVYEIDDSKTPAVEKWQFMEGVSEAFQGVPITYTCFGEENTGEQTYVIERVNNDIPEITNSPNSYADNGFVFGSCHEDGGTYYLITAENPIDNILYLNGAFAIPNLLAALHTWERPLPTGDLNGSPVTFDSSLKRKKQAAITITKSATDYFAWDPADLVNTQMGWGEIDSAEYDASTCRLTLNIKHT